tara:strand:- start:1336 stop:1479 length:144 start_codon:yes stop_codon:yes gene_type:complete
MIIVHPSIKSVLRVLKVPNWLNIKTRALGGIGINIIIQSLIKLLGGV